MKKTDLSRRDLLKNTLGGLAGVAGVAAILGSGVARGASEACELTLPDGEGPFYPQEKITHDSDLTRIHPNDAKATGQVIYVVGQVTGEDCLPVTGALVEIWQACYSGKYNHSQDTHVAPLDPNFQYWGRAVTDARGGYMFKTIVPGHYPTGGGHFRPPHIHFKVYANGFYALTTQLYFKPESYDDAALSELVDKLNKGEDVPESLKVLFQPSGAGLEPGSKRGEFDITLRRN